MARLSQRGARPVHQFSRQRLGVTLADPARLNVCKESLQPIRRSKKSLQEILKMYKIYMFKPATRFFLSQKKYFKYIYL
jgi:hypothetical protein